jgi:hypothetical protein
MNARNAARSVQGLVVGLAWLVLAAWGCQKSPSKPAGVPSGDVEFMGPVDGEALNAQVIDVRGRAVVGTLVNVYLDGVYCGSAVSYVSQDSGRFTVEDVDLGPEEGKKTLVAVASDGSGHEAARGDTIVITLDTTSPPAELESIEGAGWDGTDERWVAPFKQLFATGRTDTTAGVVRVRHELTCFAPSQADTYAAGPGEPDSVRVEIKVTRPTFEPAQVDSLIVYSFEALDAAENYTQEMFTVRWVADTTACAFLDAVDMLLYEFVNWSYVDTLHTRAYALPTAVDRGDTIYSEGHIEHYEATLKKSWFFFVDKDCQAEYPHDCLYLFIDVENCYNREGFTWSWPPERLAGMVTFASWECP